MIADAIEMNIKAGVVVIDSHGDKIGVIVDTRPEYIVVERGIFLPTHYYVPVEAISCVNGKVSLNVDMETIEDERWEVAPPLSR